MGEVYEDQERDICGYVPTTSGRRRTFRRCGRGIVLADARARGGLRVVRSGSGDAGGVAGKIRARIWSAGECFAVDSRFSADTTAAGTGEVAGAVRGGCGEDGGD